MAGGKRIRKADGCPLFSARFTPEQDTVIRAEYEAGSSTVQLAIKWNANSTSIKRAVLRAGGKIRSMSEAVRQYASKNISPRRVFSDEQEAAIAEAYRQGESTEQLAVKQGCCPYTISSILKRQDVPPRPTGGVRIHTLNEAAFDNAENNPMAAYFAGLLFADGCVHYRSQGQATITLGLYNDDGWLVGKLKEFLNSSHKLIIYRYKTPTSKSGFVTTLSVRSDRLASTLACYGILSRKSFTATVSPLMQNNRDWWRGTVDGDGYLHFDNRGYPILGLCGSEQTCVAFRDFARSITDTRANIQRNGSIWMFTMGVNPAIKMAAILYQDCCIALPRKKTVAEKMIALGHKNTWPQRLRKRADGQSG